MSEEEEEEEEDAVSSVNTHQFMGKAARGKLGKGNGPELGEQAGW